MKFELNEVRKNVHSSLSARVGMLGNKITAKKKKKEK